MLHTVPAFERIGEENAFAVLARATALAAGGRDIVNSGIGQPDFPTPPHIVEAAAKALRDGHHGYTPAVGIAPLREAVAHDIHRRFGATVSPEHVMVVPGGKVTMFAAILMFGEPGAEILYPDPGFPIYRSMIEFTGATPVPGSDPRGARLRVLGGRDPGADRPAHAPPHRQLARQPDRRRDAPA
jgi:aspartate/methionine/tyrosine aminotransferase